MARYFFGTDGNLMIERRSTPRYEATLDIDVRFGSGETFRGSTRNVSESGLQVVLPAGTPTTGTFEFAFAGIGGRAQAVWIRDEEGEVRVGLRFTSLNPADREALHGLIGSLRKELSSRFMAARG